jgi:hypothetical protein
MGVTCQPFLVYYTLDGTEPSTNSRLACDGWRADLCWQQWGSGYKLGLSGGNLVRALAVMLGFHPDACLEFGQNVSSFAPDSAARLCNSPVAPAGLYVKAPPDVPTVLFYLRNASSTLVTSSNSTSTNCRQPDCCTCRHSNCCTAVLGAGALEVGALEVELVLPRDQQVREIRFSFCVPLAPTSLNGTSCTPPTNLSRWSLYSQPIVFPVRSFVSILAVQASNASLFGPGPRARAAVPEIAPEGYIPRGSCARGGRARPCIRFIAVALSPVKGIVFRA